MNYEVLPALGGDRQEVYTGIAAEINKLKDMIGALPSGLAAQAAYLCDTVKPQMGAVRSLVDKAEGLIAKELYPYPTYETILYSHHSEPPAPVEESRFETFLRTEVADYFDAVGLQPPESPSDDAAYTRYVEAMTEEVNVLVAAAEDALLPACAAEPPDELRPLFESLYEQTQTLCESMEGRPGDVVAEAWYLCDVLKPQMAAVRDLVEEIMDAAPRYGSLFYAVCG